MYIELLKKELRDLLAYWESDVYKKFIEKNCALIVRCMYLQYLH